MKMHMWVKYWRTDSQMQITVQCPAGLFSRKRWILALSSMWQPQGLLSILQFPRWPPNLFQPDRDASINSRLVMARHSKGPSDQACANSHLTWPIVQRKHCTSSCCHDYSGRDDASPQLPQSETWNLFHLAACSSHHRIRLWILGDSTL